MTEHSIPAAATGLPTNRRELEGYIHGLIDLLDTLDADPDLEPDCGRAENVDQSNLNHMYGLTWAGEAELDHSDLEPSLCLPDGTRMKIGARYGDDCEEDAGDEGEMDEDREWSCGWAETENQASAARFSIQNDLA